MNKNYKILLSFFRKPIVFTADFYYDEYDDRDIWTSINVPDNIMDVVKNIMNSKFRTVWGEAYTETDYFQYNFSIYPKEKKLLLWMDGEFYKSSEDSSRGEITNQNFKDKCDELGIEKITANYNGSGDSGYIEEIFFNDEESNQVNHVPNIIEDELYEILESDFSGWEIDEGSKGDLNINNNFDYVINHEWWTREFQRSTQYYNLLEEKFEQ